MRSQGFSALVTMMILIISMFGSLPILSANENVSSGTTAPSMVNLDQAGAPSSSANANNTAQIELPATESIPAFTKERKKLRIMDSVMGNPRNGSRPDTLHPPTPNAIGRNSDAFGGSSAKANFQDDEPIRTANEYGFWRTTYFKDEPRAELEYMMSIGYLNPNVNPTVYVELTNEDDTSGRYFYFYVDGVLKHSQIIHGPSTTVSFSCSSWCSSYSTYLIKVAIRYGGAGHGWRLDKIWINDATIAFNAYGSPHLNVSYQYPYQTLTAYAYFEEYIRTFPRITATFSSTETTARYVYLYINGEYIGRQTSWSPPDVLTWELPSKSTLDLTSKVAKIEFKVYVPCSTCTTEVWTLEDWNTEHIYSWKTMIINDLITFATDWVPSTDTHDDIIMGMKYFSYTMFQLFEGQIIFPNLKMSWNLLSDNCNDYTKCGMAQFNIFQGDEIPGTGSNRAKTVGNMSYYAETSPEYNGFTGAHKWENSNKQIPVFPDALLLAHEFSHLRLGLYDQYDLDTFYPPCPNFIMGRSYDSNGEITPNFSNRWDDIPDHCATELPSNWTSDFEHILSTYPEFSSIYYFSNNFGDDPYPQNLFDFLLITEVTH